jgi:hypothetical protein
MVIWQPVIDKIFFDRWDAGIVTLALRGWSISQ